MNFFALLKQNSKKALLNQWGAAMAIVLIGAAVEILFSLFELLCTIALSIPNFADMLNIPEIPSGGSAKGITAAFVLATITLVLYYLIATPLKLGEMSWYYGAGIQKQDGISSIFEYFGSLRQMLKAILLNLSITIRVAVVFYVLIIPGAACIVLASNMWQGAQAPSEKMLVVGIYFCATVLLLLAAMFAMFFKKRYFLAPYLVIARPDIKVNTAIKLSVIATKGKLASLFMFDLSFLGWYLLSMLVLPIFYAKPYSGVAKALYARYLIEDKNLSISSSQLSQ